MSLTPKRRLDQTWNVAIPLYASLEKVFSWDVAYSNGPDPREQLRWVMALERGSRD